MTRLASRLLCAAVAIGLAACGGPPPSGTPKLDRLYRGLSDPLPRPDPSALRGFRILIDPGHGGSFRGTVGPDSLDESHVNLGVALYLWGLLREAGAEVHMTRSVDRDFLTPADSALAADLQVRVDAVDSLRPDAFISIHHNAQPQRDPLYNRVETYYKAGDPASLDLAFAIHRHLMRNLGIDIGEVRQGNYYILRNVSVPAVLGESSYLTHPPVEEKLKLSRTQELEAEAYFLGILDYCRRGIPSVVSITPAESLQTDPPEVVATFADRGGLGIDPDGVTMTVDGVPVEPTLSRDAGRASYRFPWDCPNRRYEVAVSARNLGGNTSPFATTAFLVSHPPALAAVTSEPGHVPEGGTLLVRARILDRRGLPVADGTAASMTTSLGTRTLTGVISEGAISFAVQIPVGTRREVRVDVACLGKHFTAAIPAAMGRAQYARSLTVVDARDGRPITDAILAVGDSSVARESPSGTYGFAVAASDPAAVSVQARGYRTVHTTGDADSVRMEPWFDGALLAKRFVIDPQGGTPRVAGVGPLGLSASYVNLRVARYLEGYLRAAGAGVLLTRSGEEVRLVEDIARMTNRYRADRYLEIRHPGGAGDSAGAVRVYHFPGSAAGETIARTVGETMAARLGVSFPGPGTTVTYPLQQTACPAIVVAAPPIAGSEEIRLGRSSYLREQAYAIFVGILRTYDIPDSGSLTVRVDDAQPADWLVTLDGAWSLVTGDDGTVTFDYVPAGQHIVTLRGGGRLHSTPVSTSGADTVFPVEPGR